MLSETQFALLKKLSEAHGAPGSEDSIRKIVTAEIKDHCDDLKVDAFGNLYVYQNVNIETKSSFIPTCMTAAHMDEIGLMVSHIDKNGFIYFSTMGGFDVKTLLNQDVIIHGMESVKGIIGSKPIHSMKPEERIKLPDIADLFIDTGLSKEELDTRIRIGAPITRVKEMSRLGHLVTGKALDNRISVFLLIEAIKQFKKRGINHVGVFTVQEEVGIRGARVAAGHVKPDIGICLDTTVSNDLPDVSERKYTTKLGDGVAVKYLDGGSITHPRFADYLCDLAQKHNIHFQREVMTIGGTDTSGIQHKSNKATTVGSLSIPTRYLHSTIETEHEGDILATLNLLNKTLEDLHNFELTPSL